METSNHLKDLLQYQLISDTSAVKYLPYTLSSLDPSSFQSSLHLTKWLARIASLLHSKEPGARWAGLCLAHRTSILRQSAMIESAQLWLGIVLPMLSMHPLPNYPTQFKRTESAPVLKAAVRLLRVIFTSALDRTEFQRQVSTPNVVKFTTALINLLGIHPDVELKVKILEALTQLVTVYPNAHRASHTALSSTTLLYLNGAAPVAIDAKILRAASDLYSVLPLTAGKVASVNLWRKSVDENLNFGWQSLARVRSTFPDQGLPKVVNPPAEDLELVVPLNMDRLRCCIEVMNSLFSVPIQRPVQVPIGKLVKFCSALLTCTNDHKVDGYVDPIIRSMEFKAVTSIRALGCQLLVCMVEKFPSPLNVHAGRLAYIIAVALESFPSSSERCALLRALDSLLCNCYPLASLFTPNRLAKAVLPILAKVLPTFEGPSGEVEASTSASKKGKKRARSFEGDEVFKTIKEPSLSTQEDCQTVLLSINVLRVTFRNPQLSKALHSVIARTVIAILLGLPRQIPSTISTNNAFVHEVHEKLLIFGSEISTGGSVMSKALPFVLADATLNKEVQRDLELLLHPRLPPLVRSLPHVEALSLFETERCQEENDITRNLFQQPSTNPLVPPVHDLHTSPAFPTTPLAPPRVVSQSVVSSIGVSMELSPTATRIEGSTQNAVAASVVPPHSTPGTTPTNPAAILVATECQNGGVVAHKADPRVANTADEDEDGDMPSIDMDSDSDSDDEK